jgi:hypothetical protein
METLERLANEGYPDPMAEALRRRNEAKQRANAVDYADAATIRTSKEARAVRRAKQARQRRRKDPQIREMLAEDRIVDTTGLTEAEARQKVQASVDLDRRRFSAQIPPALNAGPAWFHACGPEGGPPGSPRTSGLRAAAAEADPRPVLNRPGTNLHHLRMTHLHAAPASAAQPFQIVTA